MNHKWRKSGPEQSQNSDSAKKGFPLSTHAYIQTHAAQATRYERMPVWSRLSTWSAGSSSNRMAHFPLFHGGRKLRVKRVWTIKIDISHAARANNLTLLTDSCGGQNLQNMLYCCLAFLNKIKHKVWLPVQRWRAQVSWKICHRLSPKVNMKESVWPNVQLNFNSILFI